MGSRLRERAKKQGATYSLVTHGRMRPLLSHYRRKIKPTLQDPLPIVGRLLYRASLNGRGRPGGRPQRAVAMGPFLTACVGRITAKHKRAPRLFEHTRDHKSTPFPPPFYRQRWKPCAPSPPATASFFGARFLWDASSTEP